MGCLFALPENNVVARMPGMSADDVFVVVVAELDFNKIHER